MKQGSRLSRWYRGGAMLALLIAAGCGRNDDLPRQPVSGTVSFDGQPLSEAWIEFRPEGEGGVTMAGAKIDGGTYSVPLADGLIPGKYRVAISKPELNSEPSPLIELKPARKGATKKQGIDPDPYAPRFPKELIPARYNTKSDLIKEVKADQPNDFSFELTSK